jgi:hypothetical protein
MIAGLEFSRPYGTETSPCVRNRFPSNELLGYCRVSLRDKIGGSRYQCTSARPTSPSKLIVSSTLT